MARFLLIVLGILIPSLLVEAVLVHVSGRTSSLENIALSIFLALGGALWLNADGGANRAAGSRAKGGTL